MDNREKLEIPTIEFTRVTLLETTTNSTTCDCTGVIIDGNKDTCEFDT